MATDARRARFRYLGDGLFLAAVALYFINRHWIKHTPWGRAGFFHDYLNDVLLIPFWLPGVLLVHRLVGLRRHDRPPTFSEIFLHVVIWSACFEWVFWRLHIFYEHSTADPRDAVAYAAGGAFSWLLWNAGASIVKVIPESYFPARNSPRS